MLNNERLNIEEHRLKVTRRARFYTFGSLSQHTKRVWLACHGYGQLAAYFIKSFDTLDPESDFVVAPEGLSRFYTQGTSGRVGATWMTKEDRLSEIEDYVDYLDQLYSHLQVSLQDAKNAELIVLGFSQGASTVSRWLLKSEKAKADRLILWAGVFPPDLDMSTGSFPPNMKSHVCLGDKDEYINEERLNQQLELIKSHGLTPTIMRFEGTHRIPSEALQKFVARL